MSRLQQDVKLRLQALGVTGMVDNYRFVAEHYGTGRGLRKKLEQAGFNDFELDLAIPRLKTGVEINGGQFRGGRSGHGSPTGLERDAKKINQAIRLGWSIFVVTTSMADDANELAAIAAHIKRKRLLEGAWEGYEAFW
jgi:hypothetical protein